MHICRQLPTSRLSLLSASLSKISNTDSFNLSAWWTKQMCTHDWWRLECICCLLERSHFPSYCQHHHHPPICICSQDCIVWHRESSVCLVSHEALDPVELLLVCSAHRLLDKRTHLYDQYPPLLHLAVCPLKNIWETYTCVRQQYTWTDGMLSTELLPELHTDWILEIETHQQKFLAVLCSLLWFSATLS